MGVGAAVPALFWTMPPGSTDNHTFPDLSLARRMRYPSQPYRRPLRGTGSAIAGRATLGGGCE